MRVHSVSRGRSAVQTHMMTGASHVCETNTHYWDRSKGGKLQASDGSGRASLELAQAHRGAKVPRNGWEGGTYNNNNDHNVLMLCTRSYEAEGIEHPSGYDGLASARCLGTAGN